MSHPDHSKQRHPQLWVGYGLILAVILLGVTAVTTQFQYLAIRHVDAAQTAAINDLRMKHASATAKARDLENHSAELDATLAIQHADLDRQQRAIDHLERLRKADAAALTSLHNELAVHHVADAVVRARLEQLERSNIAAHTTINAATNGTHP